MKCERSVITMTLLRLNYLVYGLGKCIDDTPTETDRRGKVLLTFRRLMVINEGQRSMMVQVAQHAWMVSPVLSICSPKVGQEHSCTLMTYINMRVTGGKQGNILSKMQNHGIIKTMQISHEQKLENGKIIFRTSSSVHVFISRVFL